MYSLILTLNQQLTLVNTTTATIRKNLVPLTSLCPPPCSLSLSLSLSHTHTHTNTHTHVQIQLSSDKNPYIFTRLLQKVTDAFHLYCVVHSPVYNSLANLALGFKKKRWKKTHGRFSTSNNICSLSEGQFHPSWNVFPPPQSCIHNVVCKCVQQKALGLHIQILFTCRLE